MAVASSNDIALIEACLKANGIREYFDAVITACEVKKGKPAPDVYLEAARRLHVCPEECLVLKILFRGFRPEKMRE